MSLAGKTLTSGDLVRHPRFGSGTVRHDEGEIALVRFDDAVHECDKAELDAVAAPLQEILATKWYSPIEVITRAQAAAIESVNDTWGVLSTSRIALLPHQLWVCRRVLETWPTRWLVADDVGLGKTIEAGLVFWPLIAKGTVRRLLIICPASLVEQWNQRLRTMFDIRVAIYAGGADTERTDFWGTHDKVAASLQKLRIENKGRHQRLLESDPWDLVVVDEAHHLNADEKGGPTLGYELLEKLVDNNRVKSMLFFTGTPHRGKNFGFVSLLKLLRPDLFDPKKPLGRQLPHLREVMIRNNKQNVTDLKGNRLFHPPVVTNLEFQFSPQEQEFYEMLTDFIQSGQAYASSLDATAGKAVQLVLVAMQKLASSSVAAIRRALRGRLARIGEGRDRLDELKARRETRLTRLAERDEYEKQGDLDALSRLDEEIGELSGELRLMENEEPRLRDLVAAADRVPQETKIERIVSILHNEFAYRQVLFFTEYKATQSLLMSALMKEFGESSVTFINGDDRADEVVLPSGESKSVTLQRSDATDQFNVGKVRFLVSTEAGGEGIDLQESCHSLVHVDLPWNPMRLHQRVGRLNRYGQKHQVEVIVLRNPDTVEGRIWQILQEKMNQIMLALGHAMDEPEDLLQLVLGMTSPSLWRELFGEAPQVPRESLMRWFDSRTAQFGNKDVIKTVQELVGHCASFDFQETCDQLPKIDLPALRPFFVSMLRLNRRRIDERDDGLAFRTPDAWQREPGIFPAYQGMVFQRETRGRDAARRVLGVGHKLMGEALRQAREGVATIATLPLETLNRPLVVYRIRDKLTGEQRTVRSVTLAVEIDEAAPGGDIVLKDWELLQKLNGLVGGRGFRANDSAPPADIALVEQALDRGMSLARNTIPELGLPFRFPEIEPIAVLWPVAASGKEPETDDEDEDVGSADKGVPGARPRASKPIAKTLAADESSIEGAGSPGLMGSGDPTASAMGNSDSVRLHLQWGVEYDKTAVDFGAALVSHLGPVCGEIVLLRSDGTDEGLDVTECASALRTSEASELRFTLPLGRSDRSTELRLRFTSGSEVELSVPSSHVDEIGSPDTLQTDVEPLWLQTDPDVPSPLSLLALVANHRALHSLSLHGFAVLASKIPGFEKAEARGPDGRTIGNWRLTEAASSNSTATHPIVEAIPGLWLPVAPQTGQAPGLLFELIHTTTAHDLDLAAWKPRVAAALADHDPDLRALTECLRGFAESLPRVEVRALDGAAAAPDRPVAVLDAKSGKVTLSLDLNRSCEKLVEATLHALGHLLLGHVRPDDEYTHRDTLETILSPRPLRRWDQEVREAFPFWFEGSRKVESLADCTPTEKAQLGLWRMIGEMLGERRQLHPQAVVYQKAVYQRQAAERLVATLEDFGGAMLCDGVGLGKTYVATTVMAHYANAWREGRPDQPARPLTDPFRITVLAPYSVVSTWRREALPPLGQFGVPLSSVRVISHTALSRISSTSEILRQAKRGEPSDFEHLLLSDLVIVDEAHNFRSISARRTVVLRDLLRAQPRREPRRRVLLLTATPVNNSLDDLMQEVSLLFSRPLWLSDARTEDGYRRQAEKEVKDRCARARRSRSRSDHAALLVHGDADARFSFASEFRDDLDFGPKVQRIGDYLKEQDNKLKALQQRVRDAAHLGMQTDTLGGPVRIAEELLDRIVVQRSRRLCKEIEREHNSEVELLFRPDPGPPEQLRYSDEFDGIRDVLARFLPLFDRGEKGNRGAPRVRPLSFKIYMWHDVREGVKSPDETSSVVGLQRILALKRLESSPVSFLITLLRLTVLHAHRLWQLADLAVSAGERERAKALKQQTDSLLEAQPTAALEKIRWLATAGDIRDVRRDFMRHLSDAYAASRPAADTDDPSPQLLLIPAEQTQEEAASREELDRLLGLKDALFDDFATLLGVAPDLADIVFGRFARQEWPRSFVAGGESVDWPPSAAWGLRMVSDAKLRRLFERIVEARRRGQRIIVFSQFSDTIAYVQSVLRACESLSRQDWPMLLHGLDVPDLHRDEIEDLLRATASVTGSSEHREETVSSFAPFYRIGPHRPETQGAEEEEQKALFDEWETAWSQAIERPVHVLFSSDVLAEGVNLQDTALLVNLDVHWNPVRMIQRAGRVDRRLNPRIEKNDRFPDLEALAGRFKKPAPKYYWREHPNEGPVIVNMILPDELEAELLLRERIAVKSLAIDFTLGLEQGTGAEADWMAAYTFRGVSSLNAFQKDRAIEQVASYHEKLGRVLSERGVDPRWVEAFNGWFREAGADHGAPLIGRARIGRRDEEFQVYRRYVKPEIVDGVPHWLWSQEKPSESILNFWIGLDAQTFPPPVRKDLKWHPAASAPLSADHVLAAAVQLLDGQRPVQELPPQEVGRPLQQGVTALAAGYFGHESDRRMVQVKEFFLLQMDRL